MYCQECGSEMNYDEKSDRFNCSDCGYYEYYSVVCPHCRKTFSQEVGQDNAHNQYLRRVKRREDWAKIKDQMDRVPLTIYCAVAMRTLQSFSNKR